MYSGCVAVTGEYMEELWKSVDNYEGAYEVSSLGRIRSLDRVAVDGSNIKGRLLKFSYDGSGYNKVNLFKFGENQYLKVHRLVAIAFVPNPEGLPQVNHDDGNKENNFYKNLIWCTNQINTIHAYENKLTTNQGETHYKAKLDKEKVLFIRASTLSVTELSNKLDVSKSSIRDVINRRYWKSV